MFPRTSLNSLIIAATIASTYMPAPSGRAPIEAPGTKANREKRKRKSKRAKASRRANRK